MNINRLVGLNYNKNIDTKVSIIKDTINMNTNDTPINNKIITKNDCNKQIWIDDFILKSNILKDNFKQCEPKDLHEDLFGNLNYKCTLTIKDKIKGKIQEVNSWSQIEHFIENYNEVLVYPKEFRLSTSVKMRFIDKINAFVIDIDEVRSYNIDIALKKLSEAPVKPNYIVNSGNGLHLYYIFKHKFMFDGYTSVLSLLRYVQRVGNKCDGYNVTTKDEIKKIYNTMTEWYSNDSHVVDVLHLAHGIKIYGGKTKNVKVRSEVFKVTDVKYDLEELAEITGVELVSEEELFTLTSDNKTDIEVTQDTPVPDDIPLIATLQSIDGSPKIKLSVEEMRHLLKLKVDKLRTEYEAEARIYKKTRKPHSLPQWDQYLYVLENVRKYARYGIRQRCLHILCNRGYLFHIPFEVVRNDVRSLVPYMDSLSHEKISSEDIESAYKGYSRSHHYTNLRITELTLIPFPKLQSEIRKKTKLNKSTENIIMLEIVEQAIKANPKISARELSLILLQNNIKRGKTFISENEDIKLIREIY